MSLISSGRVLGSEGSWAKCSCGSWHARPGPIDSAHTLPPTLAFTTTRHDEIEKFVPRAFWGVALT
eukprot:COSAG01_NODE_59957_length_297_cov_0.787879_1_plen_65_part_10